MDIRRLITLVINEILPPELQLMALVGYKMMMWARKTLVWLPTSMPNVFLSRSAIILALWCPHGPKLVLSVHLSSMAVQHTPPLRTRTLSLPRFEVYLAMNDLATGRVIPNIPVAGISSLQ